MKTLVWTSAFVRAFRRVVRRQPRLKVNIERTLRQLAEDPLCPALHSHKLKGELAGVWACTVDYDNRIIFDFIHNEESGKEEILLLTMGTHDEVY